MVATPRKPELLAIVGPTASGKTQLALQLAKQYRGEIISADSRAVYKGMDIGTAKPTLKQRKEVPHWGIDLVRPGQSYSVAEFKNYAQKKIAEIKKRGKLPILVGGTGLYVDSVILDYSFNSPANQDRREQLETLTTEELQSIIESAGYNRPQNWQNRRHLIRTIETEGKKAIKEEKPKEGVLVIGIMPPREKLRQQINQREEAMFKGGLTEETRQLLAKYGEPELKKTEGIAYKFAIEVIKGRISTQEAIGKTQKSDWQYARRQWTWFKRHDFINWYSDIEQAYGYLKGSEQIS